MKHYDEDYDPFFPPNLAASLITVIAFAFVVVPGNDFVRAVALSYFLLGAISDVLINVIIGNIWSRNSLVESGSVKKDVTLAKKLRLVSWLPRFVGVFERIIFTTSFILGRYEFVGAWLVLKIIGSWQSKTGKEADTWRVKENIFLIGTALSLILSFIAAYGFWELISPQNNFFFNLINKN